jgi:hypothetical protein
MIQEIRRSFFLGLDLGQAHDPSALSVLERREVFEILGPAIALGGAPYVRFVESTYVVRRLDRFPLRTSYTQICQSVRDTCTSPSLRPPMTVREENGDESPAKYFRRIPDPALVLDSTGLGMPVRDIMRAMQLNPIPIVITRGDSPHPILGAGVGVPKRDLAQTLIVLFETHRLKIAKRIKLLPMFLKELANFRVTITASGHDVYEASSGHDDLVLSVALPLWYAEQTSKRKTPTTPLRDYLDIISR